MSFDDDLYTYSNILLIMNFFGKELLYTKLMDKENYCREKTQKKNY